MTPSSMQNPNAEMSGGARRGLSRQELRAHPMVHQYRLFCLASLFVMVICLSDRGLEWLCLAPPVIGCVTVLANWNYGPPTVLLSLATLLGVTSPVRRWTQGGWDVAYQPPAVTDLLLCMAVLAYVVGHYRLLSLMSYIFTPDPRRLPARSAPNPLRRRSPDLVTNWEMVLIGIALPVWVGLAVMVWGWVTKDRFWDEVPLRIPRLLWHALQIAWAGLLVLGVAGTVASYLRWRTATPEESLLFLQDQCWRHTRREQSSLNRWLTWARSRAQRKKETL